MSLFSSSDGAILQALDQSQAIIEFDLTGKILRANANFCRAIGYDSGEIVGRHHSMFVMPEEARSPAYAAFWQALAKGKFQQAQYKRLGKGGREVWIEASYNPVFKGKRPVKVVKFATDITASKIKSLSDNGKLEALSRAQAVIEFTPDGRIVSANENFLSVLGYRLEEIVGQHHAMFCEPAYVQSAAYRTFWEQLAGGAFVTDQFLRLGKNGRRVHIQATYNPIVDESGRVVKVVKFATDMTERVRAIEELGAGLGRLAQANISETLDRPFTREFEQLRHDFNMSIGGFQQTLVNVLGQTENLNGHSHTMREASGILAQHTREQAAALEETSAALEQITITVRQSNERVQDTRNLVKQAKEQAGHSVTVVGDTVAAMQRIETASSSIGHIIGVIDEIAFQTNLLALNAGVEAARAGEAGRGFAVVAQEVRELAQRTARAAKEIKDLISNASREVVDGVRLVGDTGRALTEIEVFVASINENIDAIAAAASEQTTGLGDISASVNSLDGMTQQNATMVARTTELSHTLAQGAATLADLVCRFQLNHNSTTREPAAAKPARHIETSAFRKTA
ncbi:methyl-accepting chemotaxis protein [Rhizobium sp. PP-CC-3G-465]|uniref:methyl-accepting chemotaxis protein n=1 Tax=Rhizobium sp. PP-CC-3G-465 TaxID=2135648 RepID=UPI001042EDAE|nr:methyl-accepting chemotaxis sensory transducer with Pas/Pac sensor [Rhizobium sp. PP-CC-3G-465]